MRDSTYMTFPKTDNLIETKVRVAVARGLGEGEESAANRGVYSW